MSANVTTNTVFEAFIEADRAMKELPAIREELASVKASHAEVTKARDAFEYDLHEREQTITNLRAELSAREAELARATFRADAVEAKHRALRGILGDGDDHIVAVDGALGHLPDSVDAQEAALGHGSPELDADAAKLTAMGQDPGPTLGDFNLPGSVSADPTAHGTESSNQSTEPDRSHSISGTVSSSAPQSGQSEADPTSPTEPQAMSGTGTDQQSASSTSAPGPSSKGSGKGQSEVNPIASADGHTASNMADADTRGDAEQSPLSATPRLAFTGRPHHSKPSGMEWGYWIVNGGEAPYWYDADTVVALKNEYRQYVGHASAA